MWKINSHLDCTETQQEFETHEDALIEMHRMAEELADLSGACVFHDSIGLSTVYDEADEEDNYICFWITDQG